MNYPGQKFFTGESVLTEWMSRGGDNMIFRAQRIGVRHVGSPAIKVTITVFTKNNDDTGDGAEVVDSSASPAAAYTIVIDDASEEIEQEVIISGDGATAVDGLKELIRFKVVCSDGGDGDYVLMRMFSPVFFDSAIPV